MHSSTLLLTLLLGLLTACRGEMTVSVDISETLVTEGADVTVRCRVAGYEPGSYIFWWKRQNDQDTQMGIASNINDVFTGTGRYAAEAAASVEDEVVWQLTITGAIPEDSGEIGCQCSDQGAQKSFAKLDIVASLTDISLWGMPSNDTHEEPEQEYQDGDKVSFREGDEYFFQCRAGGGTYPPAFQMSIGDLDITDRFTTETSFEIGDGQPGLKRLVYFGKATTHTPVVVTKTQNAKEFRCTAGVPGWDTSPLTIHIQPLLRFPPEVTCPEKVGGGLYETDIDSIRCVVKSDPPVSELTWTWRRLDKYNVSLPMGDYVNDYSHKVTDGEYPDELVSSLFLSRASPEMFREYTLVARNDLGESSSTLAFVKDNSGASVSSASGLATSMLNMTATLLLLLLLTAAMRR